MEMLDKDDEPYRQIKLPRFRQERIGNTQLESSAVSEDGNVSYNYIRDMADEYEPDIDRDDEYVLNLYRKHPEAFFALGKIIW